ncbi:MAG: Sir2 family NAD-dependent protein deacetylase [Geodermatophilaceae bacterium]
MHENNGRASITVLTGAGISTDSGIPDFRGPNGVWTRDPAAQQPFTLQNYAADPELRRLSWRNRRAHAAWTAEPNAGHHALVELERAGRLRALITQSIDGLHQRAGSRSVIELHGTLYGVQCLAATTEPRCRRPRPGSRRVRRTRRACAVAGS